MLTFPGGSSYTTTLATATINKEWTEKGVEEAIVA
jgi:hypothetical protein